MKHYTAEPCGCVKYHPSEGRPVVIVHCGTLDRDAANLRAAVTAALRKGHKA